MRLPHAGSCRVEEEQQEPCSCGTKCMGVC